MDFLAANKRYAENAEEELLRALANNGQNPVAAVVGCSDSRVPVEVIFDQLQPGQFFVIRVAGNVVSTIAVEGSIEFAVEYLKVPYLIVLGHTDCGAVKARLSGVTEGTIGELLSYIHVRSLDVDAAVRENLVHQFRQTMSIPCVSKAVKERLLAVFGMLYDLDSGMIDVVSRS